MLEYLSFRENNKKFGKFSQAIFEKNDTKIFVETLHPLKIQ